MVTAYGAIAALTTEAHSGSVTVGSQQTPVAYRSRMEVVAEHGMKVSNFNAQPIASLGAATPELKLTGDADVIVSNTQVTHPAWARIADGFIGAWLGGAIAAAWGLYPLIRRLTRAVANGSARPD